MVHASRNTADGVARFCTWDDSEQYRENRNARAEGKKRARGGESRGRGKQLLASHGLLASQAQLAAMKPSSISDQRGVAAAAGKAARDATYEHLDGGGDAGVAWKVGMVAGEAAAVKASEAAREREAGFMATKASLAEAARSGDAAEWGRLLTGLRSELELSPAEYSEFAGAAATEVLDQAEAEDGGSELPLDELGRMASDGGVLGGFGLAGVRDRIARRKGKRRKEESKL